MTNHEFMKMLFMARNTAREVAEDALALCRQVDNLVDAFYRETMEIPPVQWDYGRKEADNAENTN